MGAATRAPGPRTRHAVGTLQWVRDTNGILRRRDRLALIGQAIRYGTWTAATALRHVGSVGALVDADVLVPPDSRASREAAELLADTTPPVVANHARRSFSWAAALAHLDGQSYDREMVYVASLLHDLYLARPDDPSRPHCFTLPAANDALSLARRCGWSEPRAAATAEAITLHANVWPPRQTVEAYLVFAGSRLDAIGYRQRDLHPDTRHAVIICHPRLDFTDASVDLFKTHSVANPGSRLAFLYGLPGANWFMRHTPITEPSPPNAR